MDWLRNMLAPLKRKALLTLEETASILEIPVKDVREFLIHYDLQIFMDPAFGELTSVHSLHELKYRLISMREVLRTDRQQLLECMLKPRLPAFPYEELLDREIKRISELEEPARTLQAAALLDAWKSALNVASCLRGFHKNTTGGMYDSMQNLATRVYGVNLSRGRRKNKPGMKAHIPPKLRFNVMMYWKKEYDRQVASGELVDGAPASAPSSPSEKPSEISDEP